MNRKVHAGFGPADGGSTGKKLAASTPSDWHVLHYADLAYHCGRAEVRERERHYAKLVGEQAAAEYANAEAVGYFGRVLELTPEDDLAERYALTVAREKVYDLMGERET